MEKWECLNCGLLNPMSENNCETCKGKKIPKCPPVQDNLLIPEIDVQGLPGATPHTSYEEEGSFSDFDGKGVSAPEILPDLRAPVLPSSKRRSVAAAQPRNPVCRYPPSVQSDTSPLLTDNSERLKQEVALDQVRRSEFETLSKKVICHPSARSPHDSNILASMLSPSSSSQIPSSKEPQVKEVMNKVKEIKKQHELTGKKYVDDTFPIRFSCDENYILLRPSEINCDESSLASWTVLDHPQPSDVKQGRLGDCWFFAVLPLLIVIPGLLEKVMVTKEINEAGVYVVRLCKWGVWHTVIIDDLLPCDHHKKLIYSQSKRHQLWVSLIEKAAAKLFGSYQALRGGFMSESFGLLTSAPCENVSFDVTDSDMIWEKLLSSKEAGFLLGASCGGGNMEVNEAEYHEQGLRPRHAYSVLDVRAPRTFDNNVVRLIQLRNPWGRHSWKGAWSDWSHQWKQNLRLGIHLIPNQSQEGIFWMELDDLIKYFDSVDICKVGKDWIEVRRNGEFSNSTTHPLRGFYLIIDQNSHLEFSLIQQVPRTQEGTNSNMLDICLCVYESNREDNGKCSLGKLVTCGRRQVSRHLSCSYDLKPGNYVVVCMAFKHWPSGLVDRIFYSPDTTLPQYVLALHSNKSFTLTDLQEIDGLLADAVIELALKEGEKIQVEEGITFYRLGEGWSGYIMIVENPHQDRTLQVDADCSKSFNVVSTRGSLITKDIIPPLHRQVLMVLTQENVNESFKVKPSWTFPIIKSGHNPPLNASIKGLHQPRPL